MKLTLTPLFLFFVYAAFSQNHEENFRTIETIEQAKTYATGFSEVSVEIINAEKDVFFFDDIDTTNLEKHVGTSKTFFGRTTKLIEDTVVSLVNVQIISLDLTKMSPEVADVLLNQMESRIQSGESYWDLKKKYGHTSAQFTSSPELTNQIVQSYEVDADSLIAGSYFKWGNSKTPNKIGLLIVEKNPHLVPGFFTISYLNLDDGNFR